MNPGSTRHNLRSTLGRLSFAQKFLAPPVSQARADAYVAEYLKQVEQESLPPPLARKEARDKTRNIT